MKVSAIWLSALMSLGLCATCETFADWEFSIAEATAKSIQTGQPLMVVGTSEHCGPCQALKATLQEPQLRSTLQDLALVVLDSSDSEFLNTARRYGVPVESVPMVLMIGPEGQLLYAQPGYLSADQIEALTANTLRETGRPLTEETAIAFEEELQKTRQAAAAGDLVRALRLVTPVSTNESSSRIVKTAYAYRERIVAALNRWLAQLDERMANGDNPHEAAYQIAQIYVDVPRQYEELRRQALDLVKTYEANSNTRVPVLQAKRLVQARVEEQRMLCDAAIRSYEYITSLDPNSPTARLAQERLPAVRERKMNKLGNATM